MGLLQTPRLHRQRKGRRKTVVVLNRDELADYFEVAHDQVRTALIAANWSFHEDANGGLWASAQAAPDNLAVSTQEREQHTEEIVVDETPD
jgi:hypothetical protein